MRKILRSLFAGLMAIVIPFIMTGLANTAKAEDAKQAEKVQSIYTVTPADETWKELDSTQDKIAALRISQEVLDDLSNDELVQAILEYPLKWELVVYDNYYTGVESMEDNCDAYAELLDRGADIPCLLSALAAAYDSYIQTERVEEAINCDLLAELLLYQKKNIGKLDQETIKEICSKSWSFNYESSGEEQNSQTGKANYTVYTPKGTAVVVQTTTCGHPTGYHTTEAQSTASSYGVTYIAPGSCHYNCHSYAWYSQSTSNNYWMNNPMAYMTDGSYYQVHSGFTPPSYNISTGDRIFYGTSTNQANWHSAVMVSGASSASLAVLNCRSKWGQSGVFQHSVGTVPAFYDTVHVGVWH